MGLKRTGIGYNSEYQHANESYNITDSCLAHNYLEERREISASVLELVRPTERVADGEAVQRAQEAGAQRREGQV